VAMLAVASGVAMALAIELINDSALEEFRDALGRVNGEAQLQLISPQGNFAESAWPLIAQAPEVLDASPVLELRLGTSRQTAFRVLGIDVFRAASLTPALVPQLASAGSESTLFAVDQAFLSDSLRQNLGAPRDGDTVVIPVGLEPLRLRVAGRVDLPDPTLVLDLATAQWRCHALGQLTRIDLRLQPGLPRAIALERLRSRLQQAGLGSLELVTPEVGVQRMANLSRAYRVNLSVLALVALFTGGFLVWTALSLAVRRQRATLALLGVLGMPPHGVAALVAAQGLSVALLGSLLGAALGVAGAQALLVVAGGDLGGGYFAATSRLHLNPVTLLGFIALGTAVGAAASWIPARESALLRPIEGLRDAGGESIDPNSARTQAIGALGLGAIGVALLLLPPIADLPVGAYLAIACWLFGAILLVPALIATLVRPWIGSANRSFWSYPPVWLALRRVSQAPAQATGIVAGVVASFALGCAMAIMVESFRSSVSQWLDTVLPADLYLRAPSAGGSGGFDATTQARLAQTPGVARIEFLRSRELLLDPQSPAVALLARPLDTSNPAASLPILGSALATAECAAAGKIPIWISEPLAHRLKIKVGDPLALPIGAGEATPGTVCGVWRDYARQNGAIVIDAQTYRRLSGDGSVSDAAIWLTPNAQAETVAQAVRTALPRGAPIELRSANDLRALSLTIFDRSFAVTYALEAAAILVGLLGVAAAFGGQALARRQEFAVLCHLGGTTELLRQQIAIEAALIAGLGVLWGGAIGAAIAAILIFKVNPESFHWTMTWSLPTGLLFVTALGLLLAAVFAARLGTGITLQRGPLQAVRALG